MSSLFRKIFKRGNSGQLLTKQQLAKARQQYEGKLRKQIIAKLRQAEERRWVRNNIYTVFDNIWERCSESPRQISDYECDILPHTDDIRKKPVEELEAIYYEYARLINDYKAQQQRKKQQQQRKKKQQQQRNKQQQQRKKKQQQSKNKQQ